MAKLKMGDRIYVYLEGGKKYTSPKSKNGCEDQTFDSSKYEIEVGAAYLWDELGEDGVWYEVYVFTRIPKTLGHFKISGSIGYKNIKEELNQIVQNTIGGQEERGGRTIVKPESINIDIINKICGVTIDKNKDIIYQKENPEQNIAFKYDRYYIRKTGNMNFGYSRNLYSSEKKFVKEIDDVDRLINTSYNYSVKHFIPYIGLESIYLASTSVDVDENYAKFCVFTSISVDYDIISEVLYDSFGHTYSFCAGICPIFRLKSKEH